MFRSLCCYILWFCIFLSTSFLSSFQTSYFLSIFVSLTLKITLKTAMFISALERTVTEVFLLIWTIHWTIFTLRDNKKFCVLLFAYIIIRENNLYFIFKFLKNKSPLCNGKSNVFLTFIYQIKIKLFINLSKIQLPGQLCWFHARNVHFSLK